MTDKIPTVEVVQTRSASGRLKCDQCPECWYDGETEWCYQRWAMTEVGGKATPGPNCPNPSPSGKGYALVDVDELARLKANQKPPSIADRIRERGFEKPPCNQKHYGVCNHD